MSDRFLCGVEFLAVAALFKNALSRLRAYFFESGQSGDGATIGGIEALPAHDADRRCRYAGQMVFQAEGGVFGRPPARWPARSSAERTGHIKVEKLGAQFRED